MTDVSNVEPETQLDDLFARIARMPDADLVFLRVVWEDQDAYARRRAWESAARAIKMMGRAQLMDGARDRLSVWVNDIRYTGIFGEANTPAMPSGLDPATVRSQATPPLLDAVAAILAGDELGEEDRDLLMVPMASLQP